MANTYTNSLKTSSAKNNEIIARKIHANEGETLMEFVDTDIFSLKSTLLNYFEGNSELEVQRHFEKVFVVSMADAQQIEPPSIPMRQRKLPASFWRQDVTPSAQLCHSTTSNVTQHNDGSQHIYTSATMIGHPPSHQSRFTDAARYQVPVASRLISYAKLPVSVLTAPAQNVKLTHAQMNDRPRCSLMDTTSVYYAYGPRAGHGFNPRYNFMLIQPDIKPELPLVHGQLRGRGNKKG